MGVAANAVHRETRAAIVTTRPPPPSIMHRDSLHGTAAMELLDLDAAVRLLIAKIQPLGDVERVPLRAALGRVIITAGWASVRSPVSLR